MEKVFDVNNLKVQKNAVEKLQIFCDFLLEKNKQFNITAIRDKQGVFEKHFADSLMGKDYFFKNAKVLEVGSGGGFPSIPLKANDESLNFTLLEATGKKCEFLKAVVNKLDLKNVTVINDRAETLAKNENYREKFDICSARAVARLNTLSEYCMPFIKVGGTFVSYKGDAEEEILEAKNAVKVLGGTIEDAFCYELDGAKRTLVKIKKIKNTDKKYPRGNGKERKNPL